MVVYFTYQIPKKCEPVMLSKKIELVTIPFNNQFTINFRTNKIKNWYLTIFVWSDQEKKNENLVIIKTTIIKDIAN